jgi:hypothetical protein
MSDVEELIRIVNSKYIADGLDSTMRNIFTNLLNFGYTLTKDNIISLNYFRSEKDLIDLSLVTGYENEIKKIALPNQSYCFYKVYDEQDLYAVYKIANGFGVQVPLGKVCRAIDLNSKIPNKLSKLFSSTTSCTESGTWPIDLSVIMEKPLTIENINGEYSTGDKLIVKYVKKELKTQLIAELMEELEKEIEINV